MPARPGPWARLTQSLDSVGDYFQRPVRCGLVSYSSTPAGMRRLSQRGVQQPVACETVGRLNNPNRTAGTRGSGGVRQVIAQDEARRQGRYR